MGCVMAAFGDQDFSDVDYDSLLDDRESFRRGLLLASIDEPFLYDASGEVVLELSRSVRDYGSTAGFLAELERRTGRAYKVRRASRDEVRSLRDDYKYLRPSSLIVLIPAGLDELSVAEESVFLALMSVCESMLRRGNING